MKKVTMEISDWQLKDMKRLVAQGTPGPDGKVPATETWPQWIGAAVVHLETIVEMAEKSQS
jgi:hypothetical protein